MQKLETVELQTKDKETAMVTFIISTDEIKFVNVTGDGVTVDLATKAIRKFVGHEYSNHKITFNKLLLDFGFKNGE